MQREIVNSFVQPIRHLSSEEQGYRQFVVEDPEGLDLPGCLSVSDVRLNGHTVPPWADHSVPTDSTHKNFKDIRIPMYQLVEGPGGVPVLLRSLNSNDGKWQKGAVISVRGEWSNGDAKPVDDSNSDGLDSLGMADLRAKAVELGIPDFPPVGVAKAKVIDAIRAKQAENATA